jgi:arylsulfatase A-like enzyme
MKPLLSSTCAVLSILPLAAGFANDAADRDARRPNFIFIYTDDQRWNSLGKLDPILQTPNLDRLIDEGVWFQKATVTTPICAASRASLLTGLTERTTGVTFHTPPLAWNYVKASYPAVLKEAGYRTAFFGKFGFPVPEGAHQAMFTDFEPRPALRAWTREDGPVFIDADGRPRQMHESALEGLHFFYEVDGKARHITDIDADRTAAFLESIRPGENFCLSISTPAPHAIDRDPEQYHWSEASDSLYRDIEIPSPGETGNDSFFESRFPEIFAEGENRRRWHWRFDTPEKYQRMVKGYYRLLTDVDRMVGRIREDLDRLGMADNTVIVLMGDNGYFLGERGFAGKWTMHELSIRVPLIVYDPRLPEELRGRVIDQPVLNIDISPTLLEMAGLKAAEFVQGQSLLPLLQGEEIRLWPVTFHEHLFEYHNRLPQTEGIRTDRWKYIRYFKVDPLLEELYDLEKDPEEIVNLAVSPGHAEVLAELRALCDSRVEQYGGRWPYTDKGREEKAAAMKRAARAR